MLRYGNSLRKRINKKDRSEGGNKRRLTSAANVSSLFERFDGQIEEN